MLPWETTTYPARGLRSAPRFQSTIGNCWRYSSLCRVSFPFCKVGQLLFTLTTSRRWLISRSRGGGGGGGERLTLSLNAVAQVILQLCESHHINLLPQFIPGHLNVLADSPSRKSQVLGSEWTLCHQAFQELRHWTANIDLFATALNHRLLVYFSPMGGSLVSGDRCDASVLGQPTGVCLSPLRVDPSCPLQGSAIEGVDAHPGGSILASIPLVSGPSELLVDIPFFLPRRRDLLKQPHFDHYHQNPPVLQLTAFRISSDPLAISGSLREWLINLPTAGGHPPE